MSISSDHTSKDSRGFTLTELAIVLGVVGLILGGIWASANNVYQNRKLSEAQREIVVITQNMRKLYLGRGTLTCTSKTDITAAMVTAGVFPTDMIMTGVTYPQSPWGGNVQVFACSDYSPTDNSIFQIEYMPTMTTSQCSSLLARNVGPSQDSQLQAVWSGVGAWLSTTGGTPYDITSFGGCTLAAFAIRL